MDEPDQAGRTKIHPRLPDAAGYETNVIIMLLLLFSPHLPQEPAIHVIRGSRLESCRRTPFLKRGRATEWERHRAPPPPLSPPKVLSSLSHSLSHQALPRATMSAQRTPAQRGVPVDLPRGLSSEWKRRIRQGLDTTLLEDLPVIQTSFFWCCTHKIRCSVSRKEVHLHFLH